MAVAHQDYGTGVGVLICSGLGKDNGSSYWIDVLGLIQENAVIVKAREWVVLAVTLPGNFRAASNCTLLLKAMYKNRILGRLLVYSTRVVVLPVPAKAMILSILPGKRSQLIISSCSFVI